MTTDSLRHTDGTAATTADRTADRLPTDAPRVARLSPPVPPTHRVLAVAGGVALIAGPALFFAGLATSPVQEGDDKVSYITSLALDATLTQVSAVLLHYGNLLMGLGVLTLPWLVRGARGAVLSLIGGLLAAVALIGNSGALFADWMHLELGRSLYLEAAADISDAVLGHPAFQLSFGIAPLISVGLVIAAIGLARAGVIGWWSIPALVVGYAGMLFLPYSMPILPAVGTLPMLAVLGLAGVRVIGRVRADRRVRAA